VHPGLQLSSLPAPKDTFWAGLALVRSYKKVEA
jgi:hypothetical protein